MRFLVTCVLAATCSVVLSSSSVEADPFDERAARLIQEIAAIDPGPFNGNSRYADNSIHYAIAKLADGRIEEGLALIDRIHDEDVQRNMFFWYADMYAYLKYGHLYPPELVEKVRSAVTAYSGPLTGSTENHGVMLATGFILAHETWPDETFQHALTHGANDPYGRQWMMNRMHRFVTEGLGETDTNYYTLLYLACFAALHEFSTDPVMREMAGLTLEALLLQAAASWLDGYPIATSGRVVQTGLFEGPAPDAETDSSCAYWLYFDGPYTLQMERWAGAAETYVRTCRKSSINAVAAYRLPFTLERIARDRALPFTHLEGITRNGYIPSYRSSYVTPDYGIAGMFGLQYRNRWTEQRHRAFVRWKAPDKVGATFFLKQPYCLSRDSYDTRSIFTGATKFEQILHHGRSLLTVWDIPDGDDPEIADDDCKYIAGPVSRAAVVAQLESDGWLFLHGGSVLIAVRTMNPYFWTDLAGVGGVGTDDDFDFLRSDGLKNAVVIETARPLDYDGTGPGQVLQRFRDDILADTSLTFDPAVPAVTWVNLDGDELELRFSPVVGGNERWINGEPIDLVGYPLIDNPWTSQANESDYLAVSHGGESRLYDFEGWVVNSTELAEGAPIVASAEEAGAEATRANDDSLYSFWRAETAPAALTVDLGQVQPIDTILLRQRPDWTTSRDYTMAIEGSLDGSSFFEIRPSQPILFNTANEMRVLFKIPPVVTRFVRFDITEASPTPSFSVVKVWSVDETPPLEKPDLVVTDLEITPALPAPGDEVTFRATIENRGNLAVSDAVHAVSFRLKEEGGGSTQLAWHTIGASVAIAPGESLTVSGNSGWQPSSVGFYRILARADNTGTIDEFVEYNNDLERSLLVSAPAPDLVVTKVFWQPENPTPGEPFRFFAEVRNEGTAAMPAGDGPPLIFQRIDEQGATQVAASSSGLGGLAPGASTTVAADGLWSSPFGHLTIEAHVDPTDLVDEIVEENNTRLIPLTVRWPVEVHCWEAEATQVDPPNRLNNDAAASAGQAVFFPKSSASLEAPPAETLDYSFSLEHEGEFQLWLRMRGKNDSVWLEVDQAPWTTFDEIPLIEEEYGWQRAHDATAGFAPEVYFMGSGSRTLRVGRREASVRVDKICITSDLDRGPCGLNGIPGSVEINDGLDNQCPGDLGYGLVDETSGNSGFHYPNEPYWYSWTAQPGATVYEVARSDSPDFASCVLAQVAMPAWQDAAVPDPGGVFFYLNRPVAPNVGSWGRTSAGPERAACSGG